MTEKELQAAIVEAAKWGGWYIYHTHDSRRSAAGFPDLVMVRGREMLAWELKSSRGRLTGAQLSWLAALSAVPGVDARVVRPEHLDDAVARLASGRR